MHIARHQTWKEARNGTNASGNFNIPPLHPALGLLGIDAGFCVALVLASVLVRRARDRRELEGHTVAPQALHALSASNSESSVCSTVVSGKNCGRSLVTWIERRWADYAVIALISGWVVALRRYPRPASDAFVIGLFIVGLTLYARSSDTGNPNATERKEVDRESEKTHCKH